MSAFVAGVGSSLVASILYDVSKFVISKYIKSNVKTKLISVKEIELIIKNNFDEEFSVLYMSGEFETFIKSPLFKDTIEYYLIYKVMGGNKILLSARNKRRNPDVKALNETEIINYLSESLIENYKSSITKKPSKTLTNRFFKKFFSLATDFVMSSCDKTSLTDMCKLNFKLDYSSEVVFAKIDELKLLIEKTIECDKISLNEKFEESFDDYSRILKTRHSKAHIYLLDWFDFNSFYVPPILIKGDGSTRRFEFSEGIFRKIDFEKYEELLLENKQIDWKHIFDNSNIVYITGGAGYGKSLFLKKIINDYKEMNFLNSSEYLVIHGDLKTFIKEEYETVSLPQFLQNCMVKETGMDPKSISLDMIEYYINRGRCLILLDALDEVDKKIREEVHSTIIAFFKNKNPNNKICITSRNRGFIPEKEIEIYGILPLTRKQIETYVDNIIKLGKFNIEDKIPFLEQTKALVKIKFLNSFLVLSLLINIYKAERELPENKMELYQKCFEYISVKREREKTNTSFDWNLIQSLLKDNTFMELARMCFPNNHEVEKKDIINMLCEIYKMKYLSVNETEMASEAFLNFCSERTELFVPSSEEKYKFFHRSFFEYFYAQYLFLRVNNVSDVYSLLAKFDVDSEVIELTLAMIKQKDEMRYQSLSEYIIDKAYKEANDKKNYFNAFNIMTMAMKVVDDETYIYKFIEYLVTYSERIIHYSRNSLFGLIPNQEIIYNILSSNKEYSNKILDEYQREAKRVIIETLAGEFIYVKDDVNRKKKKLDNDYLCAIRKQFYTLISNYFFIEILLVDGSFEERASSYISDEKEILKNGIEAENVEAFKEFCLKVIKKSNLIG